MPDIVDALSRHFRLTDEERSRLLPSGKAKIFTNRVWWARTYLKKARLVDSPRKGVLRITERGSETVTSGPGSLDVKYLLQFPEFKEFHSKKKADKETPGQRTPREVLDEAFDEIRSALRSELLSLVQKCSPTFFEQLVVDLLVKMGYGGRFPDAGKAVGGSGDGGVDGVIKEDQLGLDIIYIQAKRWEAVVGRPEIQKFVGALKGHKASKGVFITTSTFSADAREYANRIEDKVILVDGEALAGFMADFDVGVTVTDRYEVKRVDSDYFLEE